jgi:hypothetical protein
MLCMQRANLASRIYLLKKKRFRTLTAPCDVELSNPEQFVSAQ